MGRLEGKVAIITGAARGMGAAHTKRFISEGASVVFTDILVDEGKQLQQELGEKSLFMKHDVTSTSDWKEVVKETVATFGNVDILVNNAGIDVPEQDLLDVSEEQYLKVISVNQHSVFYGMQAVTESMKQTGGSIINISSLAGIIGANKKLAYTASKFASRGMTKAAALELGAFNIRVNSVHPALSPPTPNILMTFRKLPIKTRRQIRRSERPCRFLSERLFYSTGSEFVVDGGSGLNDLFMRA
ncbi:LOW QUALITY PROTEIN: 3-oxoacyl-[acyl-carrier protein] reductase [Geomicrobium sp. JCM 19039]|nr:LOW QUALITY PROTEIN: 3-oxoacyl-[acyl-carrier protein] reductase [Geomicrobium sp. JCM 19039]